jgi:DNA-binding transcriptional regulator of glucitol operon
MWVSINVDDGFESHSDAISQLGYETVWVEEKGFERYAYFDTVAALGLMVEVKERQAR